MKEKGKSVFKNWWDVTEKDINATLKATKWVPAGVEYFRGGAGYRPTFRSLREAKSLESC